MRIAFFTDTFYPDVNGVASSVLNSAQELGRQGHQVVVFTTKPGKGLRPSLGLKNVRLVQTPSIPAFVYPEWRLGLFTLPWCFAELRRFKPDVIHFHTPFSMGMTAVTASKLLRTALVGTNHVFITKDNAKAICLFPGMQFFEKQVATVALSYMQLFYDACDLRLAPSSALINGLKGVGKKPFMYLPNGVAEVSVKKLSSERVKALRKRFRVTGPVILHFGRLSHEKYVDDVIRAFALVHKQAPKVQLLVIGDGPARKSFEKVAKSLKLGSSIMFAGSMDHQELVTSGVIGIAEFFVTASRMENQPMAVLEAMSHSLPIVGVHEAGMIDLVADNGFLTKAGDAKAMAGSMLKLLSNRTLQARMAKRSRALAEQFFIENTTHQLVDLYKKAILQKKRKTALKKRSNKKR